ncbi:energy transducer TonB [Hymenobacter sp. B81]|uniref:energy transducer TonB n=1 Tax=Hymenobacter sp. B81 TaxID=3344878 RepID=UPI0037DD9984
MLRALPIRNVLLGACPVPAAALTPVAGGHYCGQCRRTVQDFTQASAAELAQARAAAPDGRVCGQFSVSQLAPESRPRRLGAKLRWFAAALVLIVVQGLSARQAWAQVQARPVPAGVPEQALDLEELREPTAPARARPQPRVFGPYIERLPGYRGGWEALGKFVRDSLRYPAGPGRGRVFVDFLITETGRVADPRVLQGVSPELNAEARRLVLSMPAWEPAMNNGQSIPWRYTLPITFGPEPTSPKAKKRR